MFQLPRDDNFPSAVFIDVVDAVAAARFDATASAASETARYRACWCLVEAELLPLLPRPSSDQHFTTGSPLAHQGTRFCFVCQNHKRSEATSIRPAGRAPSRHGPPAAATCYSSWAPSSGASANSPPAAQSPTPRGCGRLTAPWRVRPSARRAPAPAAACRRTARLTTTSRGSSPLLLAIQGI